MITEEQILNYVKATWVKFSPILFTSINILLFSIFIVYIVGFLLIQRYGKNQFKVVLYILHNILLLPFIGIAVYNWGVLHPLGVLIVLITLLIGVVLLLKDLVFSTMLVSEIFQKFERLLIASIIFGMCSIFVPNIMNYGMSCIHKMTKNIINPNKKNKEKESSNDSKNKKNDVAFQEKEDIIDKVKVMLTPSFITISENGFDVFLDKHLVNKKDYVIIKDRLRDIALALSEDESYKIHQLYIGGVLRRKGGNGGYSIITSDGDAHDLPSNFIAIPEKGLDINCHEGIATTCPSEMTIIIDNDNSFRLVSNVCYIYVSPYGDVTFNPKWNI